MKAKKTILAVLAGTAMLGMAAGAQARDGWAQIHRDTFHGGHYNNGHYGNGYRYGHWRPAPRVVVRPAPVYYGPRYAPAYYDPYYAPAPVYYQPAPVISGRFPIGHHSSIGISVPLY